ncbi:ABC transporter G family member 11-like [Olea europaea var. sylvestris]|uniref:ABC transporter G family member 11-like n=1 Tax=Olea europaea var. sylvestris TaxID=158386 RepID=UPI000C1D2D05|nr:ABC transporter G family member 11-like [Olea europaea var. sylvestris]
MASSVAHCEEKNTMFETCGSSFDSETLDLVPCNGVYLTWKDLWVTVSIRKDGIKSILEGLTGYACPGEVLAIMGPSGCGKSTLLDALAGRLNSRTRQKGEILINGRKQNLAYGTSV